MNTNNWREELYKKPWYVIHDDIEEEIVKFIETQVIEKLIEEIQPDVMNENNMEATSWAKYKQRQLRAKWLSKEAA